jgi:hypothetical protein
MRTNILSLPLAHLVIETGNNEDWIDVVAYVTPEEEPVDLRGIQFEMEIRRRPEAHEVILRATTENQWISIGAGRQNGHLIIYVPERQMRGYFAGQYVGDIRARDQRFVRRCLTIDLTIVEGITKPLTVERVMA